MDLTGLNALLAKIMQYFIKKSDSELATENDVDTVPTSGSSHLITSGGVYDSIVSVLNTPV